MSTTLRLRPIPVFAVLVVLGASACMPPGLDKYSQKSKTNAPGQPGADADGMAPTGADRAQMAGPAFPRHSAKTASTAKPAAAPAAAPASARAASADQAASAPRATIYAVDRQTYRFALRENDVWESALDVLLHNYNLTVVDHQSGIISTEWDSFYLNNAVYRNKLSMRVAHNGAGGVDVIIHNNVERLRDAAQAAGTVGAVWLPAPDPANEIGRVVQNMALLLNQPPPVQPPSVMAKLQQPLSDYSTR